MRFERGKDPKEILDIGIRKDIKVILEKWVDSYGFDVSDPPILESFKKYLEERFGIPVEIIISTHYPAAPQLVAIGSFGHVAVPVFEKGMYKGYTFNIVPSPPNPKAFIIKMP